MEQTELLPAAIFLNCHIRYIYPCLLYTSVAANLGLKPLFEDTCVLVEITRNGGTEGIGEAFEKIKADYQETIRLIAEVE